MPAPRIHTLPKKERISGKKSVGMLLDAGHWGSAGMLKFCWRLREDCRDAADTEVVSGPRVMVSVSKKLFKRAVRRNLLKRRMRESYRLQKGVLDGTGVDVLIVYNSKETAGFDEIHSSVGQILRFISGKA